MECEPDEDRDQRELDREAAVELLDHAGRVTRGDGGEPCHGDFVAGMLLAHRVQLRIELVDDRQKLVRIEVGHAPRYHDRILLGVDKSPDQMFRNQVDIGLQRRDVSGSGLFRKLWHYRRKINHNLPVEI